MAGDRSFSGISAADLNAEAARVASTVTGTGRVEAVVLGNLALVALNVDGAPTGAAPGASPVGTPGQAPATGATAPGGTTSAAGPGAVVAPGGAPAVGIARPGGGTAPGPVVPGGSPAAISGGPGGTSPPGFGGAVAPTTSGRDQLHGLVATAVVSRMPFVSEVRFATTPAQVAVITQAAADVRAGKSITPRLVDLSTAAAAMATTAATMRPMPGGPPQSGATAPGKP